MKKIKYLTLFIAILVLIVSAVNFQILAQDDDSPTATSTASETATATEQIATATAIVLCPTLTPTPSITPDPSVATITPVPNETEGKYYLVQAGDTLWSIASRFEVDLDELMAVNDIDDSSSLQAGTVLLIPFTSEANEEATEELILTPTPTKNVIVSDSDCMTATATNIFTVTWYIVTKNRAIIRSCPSTDCDIVTSLGYREPVEVIGTTPDGWHEILLPDGSIAYIASYLTTQTLPPVLTATPTATYTPIPTATAVPQSNVDIASNSGSTQAPAKATKEPGGLPNTPSPSFVPSSVIAVSTQCPATIVVSLTGFDPNNSLVTLNFDYSGGTYIQAQVSIAGDGTFTSPPVDISTWPADTYTVTALGVTVQTAQFTLPLSCP